MLLFIENQNRNCLYTIGSNCRIKLESGASIHKIYITFPATTESEELARYSSYSKAREVYIDLARYLTTDTQFKSACFIMPVDTDSV